MKRQRGRLPEEQGDKRQLPGETLRRQVRHQSPPCRTALPTTWDRSRWAKMADLVLWQPAFFGVKPSLIIKGGFIAYSLMGDANASIPTPAAGPVSAHVRRPRARQIRHLVFVCLPSRPGARRAGTIGPGEARGAGARMPRQSARPRWCTMRTCRSWRSIRRPTW